MPFKNVKLCCPEPADFLHVCPENLYFLPAGRENPGPPVQRHGPVHPRPVVIRHRFFSGGKHAVACALPYGEEPAALGFDVFANDEKGAGPCPGRGQRPAWRMPQGGSTGLKSCCRQLRSCLRQDRQMSGMRAVTEADCRKRRPRLPAIRLRCSPRELPRQDGRTSCLRRRRASA